MNGYLNRSKPFNVGIAPQFAALASLVNSGTRELLAPFVLSQTGSLEMLFPETHNYLGRGCDPFSSKPAVRPSQRVNKTTTPGGEE